MRDRFVRRMTLATLHLDPTAKMLSRRHYVVDPPVAVGVYRHRNVKHILPFVAQAEELRGEVRLWALDRTHPELAQWTLGSGPGGRFQHINRLLAEHHSGPVVVFDDDVAFSEGGLRQLLGLIDIYGFDLAQPAHGPGSAHTYNFNRRRPLTAARETNFVEIGPIFVVAAKAVDRFLPFPEIGLMGFGTEASWYRHHLAGARLGIIDGTEIVHQGAVSEDYSDVVEAERATNLAAVHDLGFRSWHDLQRCIKTHRVWQHVNYVRTGRRAN